MPLTLRKHALALAAALLALAACAPDRFPQRSNLLLVTIDTLRADHLSGYGYPRATSPVLDGLAAEGVRFDQPMVQWPKTGPSFASIFTATYSKNNGIVRKIGIPLPLEFRMLAEVLRERGYSTHAVVANGAVSRDFHFDQGFDTYLETWKLPAAEPDLDPNGAERVNLLVGSLLPALREAEAPFFLWVHYLDPHFPYEPPGEWAELFQGDEWFDPSTELLVDPERSKRDMIKVGVDQILEERLDLAFYVARYDAEIAYVDSKLGELLETLGSAGLLERTLTVVTSDHGESLGEHYYYFDHGRFGFQTCLRVPLLFHYPGVLRPRVDSDPVELIHLAPTLLEAAGLELPDGAWMQGRSLAPRLFGREDAGRGRGYVFAEAGYGRQDMWQKIVRHGRFKFVDALEGGDQRWITGEVGRQFGLYDLESDPGETRNVIEEHPAEAERLLRTLSAWYREPFEVLIDDAEEGEEREMDAKTRDQLKALGYLQ